MAEIAVAGKVVDSLFGVAKKEISYMWNSTQNVEKLKNEVENLKVMRARVRQQIDIAKSEGDNLLLGVEHWVHQADEEISKAEEFLEQVANAKTTCFTLRLFGNWTTLHHHGKMATKKASYLLQHQEFGKDFEICVSVAKPAPGPLDVYQNKNLDDIDTQNSALNDIIAALEDESIQIIGIYGLGGVGKTTLAKEVAKIAKTNMLFAYVAFTTVSPEVHVEKIKNDIEDATRRIMNGYKILIILDDVWEKLNLEELCIPCGSNHMNCKILLTSRSQDVCDKMNAQSKIYVPSLLTEEAWILFKHVVGEQVETNANLKRVAMKVAEECGGLPLLIQAVGNALKDKRIEIWNSALARLKQRSPFDIHPDISRAFTHLQVSYDYLRSKEAKSCFLLCSLFPKDAHILLEDLVRYGVGLKKFDYLGSIEDARGRVQTAVNILTSSGLLLEVNDKSKTKMHTVVRDVALVIASIGENKFLVETGKDLKEWLPRSNALESYTGISLMRNQIRKLPPYEVHLPLLDTLLVQKNGKIPKIYDEFIRGIKEVNVLDMAWNEISALPKSLKLLTKLRMLNLEGNEYLHEISILGELKVLEILILNHTGIKEIPQEIGQLENLRRLEIIHCRYLCHITPGVISKLWRLEELCIQFSWVRERVYDCIIEVMNLVKLTYLDLMVPFFDMIPEGFNSEKLKGFVIQIGRDFRAVNSTSSSERYLVIHKHYVGIPFLKWIKTMIEVSSPHVSLRSIKNLKNIIPDLYDEGFHKLEYIELNDCPNVSCLVDSTSCDREHGKTKEKFFMELKHLHLYRLVKLEVLWNCTDQYISLTNLVRLDIHGCNRLVRVFPVNVARWLVSLKELRISASDGLKEVIWGGGDDKENNGGDTEIVELSANIIMFPCLATIKFHELRSLKSFYSGDSVIKYPSLVYVTVKYCNTMKIWGPGIHETPKLKFVDEVPILDGPNALNDAVAKSTEAWKKKQDERTK